MSEMGFQTNMGVTRHEGKKIEPFDHQGHICAHKKKKMVPAE